MEEGLRRISAADLPDIVLCDIGLPGMDGIEGIKILKEKFPEFFDSGIITLTRIKEYFNEGTFEKIEKAFKNFEVYFFIPNYTMENIDNCNNYYNKLYKV